MADNNSIETQTGNPEESVESNTNTFKNKYLNTNMLTKFAVGSGLVALGAAIFLKYRR